MGSSSKTLSAKGGHRKGNDGASPLCVSDTPGRCPDGEHITGRVWWVMPIKVMCPALSLSAKEQVQPESP